MASSEPRQVLVWDIHKKLPLLNASQLYKLAASLEEEENSELSELSEPELFYYIIDFLKSKKLMGLEDAGMACLLALQDDINDLLGLRASSNQTSPLSQRRGSAVLALRTDNIASPCQSIPIPMGRVNCNSDSGGRGGAGNLPLPATTQVVKISDVAAFLPRREFKIQGGQLSDSGSEIPFTQLCKQIEEAVREGFSDSEVIRAVLRVTKNGHFKELLTNKEDLTVVELKTLLRAHVRDKSSTELFQELSNAKQQDKETPQQFVYRLMALRQRVLLASNHTDNDFNYDRALVQGVFLHSLYQGLNEKNCEIRRDLKPFLRNPQVLDSVILEQVTKLATEEAERVKRLSVLSKPRLATVSATQQPEVQEQRPKLVDAGVEANRAAIQQLTAQVAALAQNVDKLVKTSQSEPSWGNATLPNITQFPPSATNQYPLPDTQYLPPVTTQCVPSATPQHALPNGIQFRPSTSTQRRSAKGKCRECIQQGHEQCPHCFRCGQVGHRAVGCSSRSGSGNGVRSLGRDGQ